MQENETKQKPRTNSAPNSQRVNLVLNKRPNALTMKLSNRASKVVRGNGYVPVPKPDGAVKQATFINATVRETYRTGDGDTPAFYRPGSLDFLKCKSVGHRC